MPFERSSQPDLGKIATPAGEGCEGQEPWSASDVVHPMHPMQLDALDLELCHPPALPPEEVPVVLETLSWWGELFSLGRRGLALLRVPMHVVLVGFGVYLLAFNLSVVRGKSMAPGIFDGDRILVDQLSYLFTDVERGDIIVLQYPRDPKLDYIKRVVGLPGDEIVMTDGDLYINGTRVRESYLLERDPYTDLKLTVKPEHYFVLGDNRLHSSDSREFGQVQAEYVRGRVDLRLWPIERIGRIR